MQCFVYSVWSTQVGIALFATSFFQLYIRSHSWRLYIGLPSRCLPPVLLACSAHSCTFFRFCLFVRLCRQRFHQVGLSCFHCVQPFFPCYGRFLDDITSVGWGLVVMWLCPGCGWLCRRPDNFPRFRFDCLVPLCASFFILS